MTTEAPEVVGQSPYARLRAAAVQLLHRQPIPPPDLAAYEIVHARLMKAAADAVADIPLDERIRMLPRVLASLHWFGPLTPWLRDPEISDLFVNGPALPVCYVKNGLHVRTEMLLARPWIDLLVKVFQAGAGGDDDDLLNRFDDEHAILELRSGAFRVQAMHTAVAPDGPAVCVRRVRASQFTIPQLTARGSFPAEAAEWLTQLVPARANFLVGGATGSGKTTLLSALIDAVPRDERMIVIEDTREIALDHPDRLYLERGGPYSLRSLVKASMRLYPQRLIVGEVRGAETIDLLDALNSGHAGSFCTIHANSARECLHKLESYILYADPSIPLSALRQNIAQRIHFVLFMHQDDDTGERRLESVAEVVGGTEKGYNLNPIWEWNSTARALEYRAVVTERWRAHMKRTDFRPGRG